MRDKLVISLIDDKGRKRTFEFWFYDQFISIYVRGFTDDETFLKQVPKFRKIWGCWYYCFESFIPRFVFGKILSSEESVKKFLDWFSKSEKKKIKSSL